MARVKHYNPDTQIWEYSDIAFDSSSSSEGGFSPRANVTQTNDGAVITIVDKLGTTTATIKHGDNYELTDDDKQEIAELTAPLVEVQGGGSTSIELDTTLKVSGKAADAKSVGDELDKKLSKSGGTMTGKIIFPTGDQNVGFANSEDMKIFGYGPVDGTVHMRMGDTQYPFQIRGNGDRPKYNDSEIALMGDIPEGDNIELDTTMTVSGKAADAKAVGDALDGKISNQGTEERPSYNNLQLAFLDDVPTDEHINELINTTSDVFVAEVHKTTYAEVKAAEGQKAVFCYGGDEGQTYPLTSDVGGPISFSIYDPFKKTHDTWELHQDDTWTYESVPAVSEGGEVSWDCVITTHVRPPLSNHNIVNFSVVSGSLLNVCEKINRGEKPNVLYQYIGIYETDFFNYYSEAVNVEHFGYGEYYGDAADTPAGLYISFILCGELVEVTSENADITNNTITSFEVKTIPAEGGLPEVIVGPDEPTENSILLWVNTNAQEEPEYDYGNDSSPGGYYTPAVKQNNEDTATFSFTASNGDMPSVPSVTLNLPKGDDGIPGGYYAPNVTQSNETTAILTFTPSNADMPSVPSVTLNLPKGADGTGVTILGSYDSESELKSAHPTGAHGDSYLVNGSLYVWSATANNWENVGNIQGAKGDDGIPGGYYTPAIKQNNENTATFSFTASKSDMPSVSNVTLNLPKGASGNNGGYYTPRVTQSNETTATLAFTASKSDMPSVSNVTLNLPKGEKGDPGDSGEFTGTTVSQINTYLTTLENAGKMTARFSGTYTVSEKIYVPAGMTIIGGTFVASSSYDNALFSAKGDNVRLIGVTMKAPAHNKVPEIYQNNEQTTNARASNVMGLYSKEHDGVALIDCVCDKIIPAKINYGSGIISGCTITDTPMFVWATNSKMHISNNDVSICDTGLDYYYHVYYLDENSELYANNNRIRCNTSKAFFDVYHLMTAGNTGTYHATGIVEGDVITGNFQHIIDCHYADLVLRNCYIKNTNTGEWSEFSNHSYSSFTYHGCELIYDNATSQSLDSSLKAPVGYYQCLIQRTTSVSKRCTLKGCKVEQTLNNAYALSLNSDVYDCEFHLHGTASGIAAYASGTFTFDLIGNLFAFEDSSHTGDYLVRCSASEGCICNNVVTGAKTEKFWYNNTEIGSCANNFVKVRG